MPFEPLTRLFHSGKLPAVVSDSPEVLKQFSSVGFQIYSTSALCSGAAQAPREVVHVPAVPAAHPNASLNTALSESAVLFIPLLAFSYDERAVNYLIRRLMTLDFAETTAQNRKLVEYVQHCTEPIRISSGDRLLTVDLGKDVDVFAPMLDLEISPGQSISIIQFLEVGLVPNERRTSFDANGQLVCDGVSVAHHLHSHFVSGPPAARAWAMFSRLREDKEFPLTLDIKNSRVVSIKTRSGIDVLPDVLPLTDEVLRGELTELAFGSLRPSPKTDWTINSQLNEPIGCLHVGLGAGEQAGHIDFVSAHSALLNFTDFTAPRPAL